MIKITFLAIRHLLIQQFPVKSIAKDLGFMSCGISKSDFLNHEAERFEKWLKNNYHGTMSYMERNFDKRLDTTKLVEGSKSVISLLFNYYPC